MPGLTTRPIRLRPQAAGPTTPITPAASGCKAWVFNGWSTSGLMDIASIAPSASYDFTIEPVADQSYGLYPKAGVLPAGMWFISGMCVCTFAGNPTNGDVTVSWPNLDVEIDPANPVANGGIIHGLSPARSSSHAFPFEGVVMVDDDWVPVIEVRNGTNQTMTDLRIYFDAIGSCADEHYTTEAPPFRACIGANTTSTSTVTFRQIQVLPAGIDSLGGEPGDTWEWEAEAPSHHTTLTVTEFSDFGTFNLPVTLVSNIGGTKKWVGTAIRQSLDSDNPTVRFRWTPANPGGSYKIILCDIPPEDP